jgi:hypothetical protein
MEASRRGHVDVADIEAKDAYTVHARGMNLESDSLIGRMFGPGHLSYGQKGDDKRCNPS